jgi:hypothetical protein
MISSGRLHAVSRVSSSSVLRQSDNRMTTRRRARAEASCSRAAFNASASLVTPWPRSRRSRSATTAGAMSLPRGLMTSTVAAKDSTACSCGARSAQAAATVAAAASRAPLIEPDRSTTTAKAVRGRAQCTVVRSSGPTGPGRAAEMLSIEASMSRSPSVAPRAGRSREVPCIVGRPARARSSTIWALSRIAASRRRSSVAVVMRASSSNAVGSPARARLMASSSSVPASGLISAKRG